MRCAVFLSTLFALSASAADRVPESFVVANDYVVLNHLLPVQPFQNQDEHGKKLEVSPGHFGSLVCEPSFSGAMRLALDFDSEGPPEQYRLIVTQEESNISQWLAQKARGGVQEEVKIIRTEALIDSEFGLAIFKAWTSMILNTRYAKKPREHITDGTYYRASVTPGGYPTIYGETHSPHAGLPKEFVELGETLAEYPSSNPADRPAVRAKLLKRLRSLESRARRM